MEKYKRFIECTVPGTACNMKCKYCYVSQLESASTKDIAHFKSSPEIIGKSLRQDRIGGCAYINICGIGETLLPRELPEIIHNILLQGHYVNVYTNGSISSRFDELCKIPSELLKRLSFSFSFHYLELCRLNKLQVFFDNFAKVKAKGCSVICNMVLDDDYLPYIDEIKQLTKSNLGAYPQISFPKKANRWGNFSSLCKDENKSLCIGKEFSSLYLDFTEKYYNYNKRKFCYAGAWSFYLDLATGNISKCYGHSWRQNIYENIDIPIKYAAVGNHCFSRACGGGLFLPMGIVPKLHAPCYSILKDRPEAGWYTAEYKEFLSHQLFESNTQYGFGKRLLTNFWHPMDEIYHKSVQVLQYIKKKL